MITLYISFLYILIVYVYMCSYFLRLLLTVEQKYICYAFYENKRKTEL